METVISKIYALLLVANQKYVFSEIRDKCGGKDYHCFLRYVKNIKDKNNPDTSRHIHGKNLNPIFQNVMQTNISANS